MQAQRIISDVTTEQGVIRVLSYFIQKENTCMFFLDIRDRHGLTAISPFLTRPWVDLET